MIYKSYEEESAQKIVLNYILPRIETFLHIQQRVDEEEIAFLIEELLFKQGKVRKAHGGRELNGKCMKDMMKTFNYKNLKKVVEEFKSFKAIYDIFKEEWKEQLFKENS